MGTWIKAIWKPAIVLSCMFPFFLMLVEWLFRIAGQEGSGAIAFFGPSLAAAGVGFLVPLTIAKPVESKISLDPNQVAALEKQGIVLKLKRHDAFSQFVWVAILLFVVIWIGAFLLSTKLPNVAFIALPAHVWLGLANYFIGIVLTCVKEVI